MTEKRTINVAYTTSNSGVDGGHEVSVRRAPWETADEPMVDRDRDGRSIDDQIPKENTK